MPNTTPAASVPFSRCLCARMIVSERLVRRPIVSHSDERAAEVKQHHMPFLPVLTTVATPSPPCSLLLGCALNVLLSFRPAATMSSISGCGSEATHSDFERKDLGRVSPDAVPRTIPSPNALFPIPRLGHPCPPGNGQVSWPRNVPSWPRRLSGC